MAVFKEQRKLEKQMIKQAKRDSKQEVNAQKKEERERAKYSGGRSYFNNPQLGGYTKQYREVKGGVSGEKYGTADKPKLVAR